jgi:uncharacterized protein
MNPTKAEKLILLMLSEIHAHLGIEGMVDASKIKAAVTTGNGWSLPSFHHEDYSDEEANYVKAVLGMWKHIEESIAALSVEDRTQVQRLDQLEDGSCFPGFYNSVRGNRCWAIAEHMINDLGLWPHFETHDLRREHDLHDLEECYDNMLAVYPITGGVMFGRPMPLKSINWLLTEFNKGPAIREAQIGSHEEPVYDITDW